VSEEKGEGEAHATCESRCTEDRLTKEAETRRRGDSDFWWRGDETTRGWRGQAWWGAGRQRHTEQMEKKNGEKGGRGRRPAAFYGGPVARAKRNKGGGAGGSGVRHRVEGKMGRREGPREQRGTARAAGISPRSARAGSAIAVRQERAAERE
jgi:hypothetical protein